MKANLLLSISFCLGFLIISCQQDDDFIPDDTNPPPTEITYDIDANGIPKLIEIDYTIIDSISQISKFRSGIGHDYSDSTEACRSMKHYYPVAKGTPIYAPISGTVNWLQEEWAGTKIMLNVTAEPAFYVELFHVELKDALEVGTTVTAGQLLGWHASNQTSSDIAVFVRVPSTSSPEGAETRFISYFDLMPDALFSTYQARGLSHRKDLIISKAERDQDPLDCNSPWPSPDGAGTLANWAVLQ